MIGSIKQTAEYIGKYLKEKPLVGIILGSGLGGLVNNISKEHSFDYDEIPDFPVSTIDGHHGKLVFGKIGGKNIVAMQGRFHYYEGYTMKEVTFPIRVMKLLGIKYLFVSNASGGLNKSFEVGDLMIIKDHINLFPENPLRGMNVDELGPRFPEMQYTYNKALIDKANKIAKENNIKLQSGIYVGSSGPTLETPSEYNHFRTIGADSTGMSTVPEVIVARHMNMTCFGISVITNLAEPEENGSNVTHDKVQDVAKAAEPNMTFIFRELIKSL